jgi:SAM-dependent methyltransferase
MRMDFHQIKAYWEERATKDSGAQSTTQDYYMREIEFRVLRNIILRFGPVSLCDIGCGDALTTIRLAMEFPSITFWGYDYSDAMLRNAQNNLGQARISNLNIGPCDVTKNVPGNYDMIFTTRCLINLPSWTLQKEALANIHRSLRDEGVYAMIENFIEGHQEFNRIREAYGLPPIPVRDHNLFFERERLLESIAGEFNVIEEVNISSTYYLVSRIIYSKICQVRNVQPDYFDEHHAYGATLPFCGEFGPVRMLILKRK